MGKSTIIRDTIISQNELSEAGWKFTENFYAEYQIWRNDTYRLLWDKGLKKVILLYYSQSFLEKPS